MLGTGSLQQSLREYRQKLTGRGPVITEYVPSPDRSLFYEQNYQNRDGAKGPFIVGAVRDKRGVFRGVMHGPII